MKRLIWLLVIVVGLLGAGFAARMAMALDDTATVSLTVPAVLQIVGLDSFSLTLAAVPGTATGSDTFTVNSNNATGVTVTGSCSVFSPALVDTTPTTTITGGVSAGPGSITPTAAVAVGVVLADAPGARTATLTITATNNA